MRTAIILAAGLGTRLMPLTKSIPKPLLDVAGLPIIVHILDHLKAAGISRFIIVINPRFENLFKELIPVRFNIQYVHQVKPTGMTDAILAARQHVTGSGSFVVCAGDMIVPDDHVADVVKEHDASRPFATLSLFKASIDYVKGLGNVKMMDDDDRRVSRIIEKPTKDMLLSNVYSLPFYAFDEEIFTYLDKCPVSSRGERELQDAIQMAITGNKIVRGVVINRIFSKDEAEFRREIAPLNITDIQDYFNACMAAIAEAGVLVPQNILCTLIEPVRIGEGCNISDNALLGPGVIVGARVTIDSLSEVSFSILQDGCKVGKKCIIDHAVIASGATVPDGTKITGKPGETRLVE